VKQATPSTFNGADTLLGALVDAGVEVCFANPGTSEMQMVTAMDHVEGMHPVLVLFEGVATGAADGYGRMTDKPAATMLHLGPGLSNGMANLHNARRAHTPMVNLVGDHATTHLELDAPLTSDIVAQANTVCDWVTVNGSANTLATDGINAVVAAYQGAGQVATLVVPANHAWDVIEAPLANKLFEKPVQARVGRDKISQAAASLRQGDKQVALLLGGRGLRDRALDAAGRISRATGARVLSETFPARWRRGAGIFSPQPVPYFAELAQGMLRDLDTIILLGAKAPVAFFAYPGLPGVLTAPGTELQLLATVDEDVEEALVALALELDAAKPGESQARISPPPPQEELCPAGVGAVIAEFMPENSIVSEEAATSSLGFYPMTAGAAAHDVLSLTGGSIGQGLPVAIGAAIACPDRKVISLLGDGCAMYTIQSLWTLVRENLDVTVVVYKNNSYAILNIELMRTGAGEGGDKARSLMSLDNPELDWIAMARSMGVSARRVVTVEDFRSAFSEAMTQRGPRLIEVCLAEIDWIAALKKMAGPDL
jgi:acetolactate synthase-1/2/3 large subunit